MICKVKIFAFLKNIYGFVFNINQIGKLIIITRGEKGSVAIKNNELVECEVKKDLKIVDLTGAGDLFAAGFLHGYVNNLTMKQSLEKGTDMASKIIQVFGARLKN